MLLSSVCTDSDLVGISFSSDGSLSVWEVSDPFVDILFIWAVSSSKLVCSTGIGSEIIFKDSLSVLLSSTGLDSELIVKGLWSDCWSSACEPFDPSVNSLSSWTGSSSNLLFSSFFVSELIVKVSLPECWSSVGELSASSDTILLKTAGSSSILWISTCCDSELISRVSWSWCSACELFDLSVGTLPGFKKNYY